MPLPLALFASSYNEDDESGTTLNQNSKASYIPSKNNKNNYMLDGNGNSNNNNNDKPKNKNPPNMRKTIKQKPSAPNESKLSALLKSMDESSDSENENDDGHSNLVNYKGVSENNNNNNNNSSSMFPPLPELNYKGPSMMQSLSQSSSPSSSQSSPGSHTPDIPTSSTGAVSNSSYDNIPSTYANQYYKQFVPYMNQSSSEMPEQPKSELIEKLNYIIDILEEQQDYKTNSIFEDLILYAFLGIFVIFIVDSFSRSGKYVR
jgi:hypothetical protein